MNNSFQTSNGVSYLARQTTDMAPVTVDTTVDPLSMSNIIRSDVVLVENLQVDIQPALQVLPCENAVFRRNYSFF